MTDYGWDLPPGCTAEMVDDAMDPDRAEREAEERRDWLMELADAKRHMEEDGV